VDVGSSLVEHGSVGLLFLALVAAGVGAPLPEDLTLLVAGALVRRGVARIEMAVPLCFLGVVLGDLLLFNIARRVGTAAARWTGTAERPRWAKVQRLFDRHGSLIVFGSRFIGGMRTASFGVAGARGMPLWRFVAIDASAALLSVPLMMGLGYVFADRLEHMHRALSHAQYGLLAAVIAGALGYWVITRLMRRGQPGPAR
jgi:membrane protein DedA with SNARE-associated domain